MGIQIALVTGYRWQGLYVSDILVYEAISIGIEKIMSYALHHHVDQFETYAADMDWLEEMGSYPKNLQEVRINTGKTLAQVWGID